MARHYERKCNCNALSSSSDFQLRLNVLEARGAHSKQYEGSSTLHIGMTCLLQSLAALAKDKSVARDRIPAEALKALDWHSQVLVMEIFEKRLNADSGFSGVVSDWTQLLAQFIPKSGGNLDIIDFWRAVLISGAVQKWYLSCLLLGADSNLEQMPYYIMGFRKGFQTAMLVETLRMCLLQAKDWLMPLAMANTDADAAFESIRHDCLVAGWEWLGAPTLLVAAFYREMAPANVQVVICGESTQPEGSANLCGKVATPTHWNVLIAYVVRDLVPSWLERGFGFRLAQVIVLFLAWADDFTLVASSVEQLQKMLTEFARVLRAHGIDPKESKSQCFANQAAWKQYKGTSTRMRIQLDDKAFATVRYAGEEGDLLVDWSERA